METTTTTFGIHPLTPDRWDDLEALFGPRGAYGGCWCMFWRVSRAQSELAGLGNVASLEVRPRWRGQ